MGRQDYETETLSATMAFEWQRGATQNLEILNNVSPALIKSQTLAVTFSAKDYGADASDVAPTLRAMGHAGSHANGGGQVAVAVSLRGRDGGGTAELGGELANALRASQGGGDKPHVLQTAVRRLTPVECERLQGFPDNWTLVPHRGKPAADGPRYKAIGNSMAVPVMRWIGERIAAVEAITANRRAL
jgi:DNA (cytosine-5)-methyltransferase 1